MLQGKMGGPGEKLLILCVWEAQQPATDEDRRGCGSVMHAYRTSVVGENRNIYEISDFDQVRMLKHAGS